MKQSYTKPPIFERCQKEFGVNWDTVIITYGDTIYSKDPIPDHLIAHESVHVVQQTEMGKDKWWDEYFKNPQFRLSQEIPAYKAQIEFLQRNYNRPERKRWEKHIYKSMARSYGSMCTEKEARELLT